MPATSGSSPHASFVRPQSGCRARLIVGHQYVSPRPRPPSSSGWLCPRHSSAIAEATARMNFSSHVTESESGMGKLVPSPVPFWIPCSASFQKS